MLAWSIPKHFRVAGVMALPFLVRIDNGVPFIFCECAAFVEAISHALALGRRAIGSVEHHECRIILSTAKARGVGVVDNGRTREHCSDFVGMQCQWLLIPVNQVGTNRMAPVHIFPIALIWIVLVEHMVFATIENQAVRVVNPSATGGKMILRSAAFVVNHRPAHD